MFNLPLSLQHMVQNQMTPAYQQFPQPTSLEELQAQQQQVAAQQQAAAQQAAQQQAQQTAASSQQQTAPESAFKTVQAVTSDPGQLPLSLTVTQTVPGQPNGVENAVMVVSKVSRVWMEKTFLTVR